MGTNSHRYRYKFKVETPTKERDQQLLDLITIDILKLEQQNISSEDIINLSMNKITNSSFNKHPCRRISSIAVSFNLLKYSCKQCAVIKPYMNFQNISLGK